MQKAKNEVTYLADMHTKDLTTGSPMKLILSFMLPLVFGLLFQQVYSMVDTIVVGKFLGVDALAGLPFPWRRNSDSGILTGCAGSSAI